MFQLNKLGTNNCELFVSTNNICQPKLTTYKQKYGEFITLAN